MNTNSRLKELCLYSLWLISLILSTSLDQQAIAAPAQKLQILDISEREHQGRNTITVNLSTPLNPKDNFQDYFNLSQKEGGRIDGGWVLDKNGKTVRFQHSDPSTQYQVSIY